MVLGPGPTASVSAAAPTRYIPVADWPAYHPWPSRGALRHLVVHSDERGLTGVFIRVGDRVLVDEHRFLSWIESHRVPS